MKYLLMHYEMTEIIEVIVATIVFPLVIFFNPLFPHHSLFGMSVGMITGTVEEE